MILLFALLVDLYYTPWKSAGRPGNVWRRGVLAKATSPGGGVVWRCSTRIKPLFFSPHHRHQVWLQCRTRLCHAPHAELSTKPHGNKTAQCPPCQQTFSRNNNNAWLACILTSLIFAGSTNGSHQGFGAELHIVGPWERQSSVRARKRSDQQMHTPTDRIQYD